MFFTLLSNFASLCASRFILLRQSDSSLSMTSGAEATQANEIDAEEFARAVQSLKAGKTEEAKGNFLALERNMPGNPAILSKSWTHCHERTPHRSSSSASGARVLLKILHNALSNAVQWGRTRLQKPDVAHDFDPWESYRSAILLRYRQRRRVVSISWFLLICGSLWLRWWGRRRRAYEEELGASNGTASSDFHNDFFRLSLHSFDHSFSRPNRHSVPRF
jgi:hypothetical protein